ncbi:hypothetical protein TNIN_80671 [Trichonephila inaurata madagascariensis]|uniref:RRM domain-containing protein n=1 Tax=Trichonephila inaurata madagascariensis TaxID=2747483 RepID=A0A8X6IE60_9ARAC|nr:hypothetical protein TNIN_80671 [Trichonephila inaurata madagascariensis]
MTTDTLLLAFRRFVAYRGLCSMVISDNARTFKRAALVLQQMWKVLNHADIKKEDLIKVFSKFGVITRVKVLKGKSAVYPMYGFVTFRTKEQYDLAMLVAKTEGVRFKGRRLHVEVALSTEVAKIEKDHPNEEDFSKLGYLPKTIYISPIPMKANINDLRNQFTRFGEVKEVKICEGKQISPTEYGFVTFDSEEDVQRALDASKTEDIMVKGQDLHVARAGNKPLHTDKRSFDPSLLNLKGLSLEGKDGGNNSKAKDDNVPKHNVSKKVFVPKKIFVGQLPLGIGHNDLKNHFVRFGAVKFAKICRGRRSAYSNYGFVVFAKQNSVEQAIEAYKADKIYMKGNKLYVAPALDKTVTDAAGAKVYTHFQSFFKDKSTIKKEKSWYEMQVGDQLPRENLNFSVALPKS